MRNMSQDWVSEAVALYGKRYNMIGFWEPTKKYYEDLATKFEALYARTPEEYKTGVHVLAPGAASLGEDIVIVDGKLTHCVHFHCGSCGGSSIVNRSGKSWCHKCDKYVPAYPW